MVAAQGTPQYGLCANTKPLDAIFIAVSTDATFAMVDQNNNSVVFGVIAAGTTLPVSPCRISAIAAGTVIPMYK